MNKIKLQNLTPDVYYNQSRDFQFIGRLYDTVLNSVKTNSELIYNLPLSENSDEKLIDLMTLTLGFKSRHNYNVKQLTSLCSAFMTVIRNKGNINSIILAVSALLNAEGINEDLKYTYDENYTILNLFISQNLKDINLLKDLLIYILPAGMSCNIIKEFRLNSIATTELTSSDEINIFEGTYTSSANEVVSKKLIGTLTQAKSTVVSANEYGITEALAKSYPGLLANSDIYRPIMEGSASVASLYYNITYVTNGGKIINNSSTKYQYKVGEGCSLPVATKNGTGTDFDHWYTGPNGTGDLVESITATDVGNKILYANYNSNKETK